MNKILQYQNVVTSLGYFFYELLKLKTYLTPKVHIIPKGACHVPSILRNAIPKIKQPNYQDKTSQSILKSI